MKYSCKLAMVMLAMASLLLATACAKQIEERKPVPAQMPEWCIKPSGVFNDTQRGSLVVGVGSVSGIKSPAMARDNADGRARTEVARIFNDFVEKLLAGYQQQYASDPNLAAEIEQATKAIAKLNSRSSAIEDRYVDEKDDTWYAKAVVSYKAFNDLLQGAADLSPRFRQFAQNTAGVIFSELTKHGGPSNP